MHRLPYVRHLANTAVGGVPELTYSTSAKPAFKAQLRELYKRVHPDLFHEHPEARDANEKSFKLLQEYISVSKEGGSFESSAGVPYRFEFFLRKELQPAKEGATNNIPAVERVALTLPPPGRLGGHSAAAEQLPRGAEQGLGRLLAACGLPNPYADTGFQSTSSWHPRQTISAQRLRDFVPEAAELLRQSEAANFGPQQHLRAARAALKLGRQVTAEFGSEARSLGTSQKAELLQRLANALDKVPQDVRRLHFLIGHGYGMDSHGRVRLNASDTALMWTGFLLQLDIEGCHKRQAAVLGVRELEASVAAALGLPVIFTKAHLTLQPSYRVFLEALAAAVQKRGPLFQPLASDVSLQVKDEGSRAAGGGFEVDVGAGVMVVPVTATPDEVYSHCQKNIAQLNKAVQEEARASQELEFLRHQTERRLRLRQLAFDSTVPAKQLQACCLRLNQASGELKGVFDGLSVRISHINEASADSSFIDIAWNFDV